MDFSEALGHAKAGKRIARAGWNGKGQWVCFMPPCVVPDGVVNGRTKKFYPEGDLNVGGYFVIFTTQGIWQPGWLASQGDMLADDWDIFS